MIRLRFDDMTRATRSHTMTEATAETPAILAAARGLLAAALPLIERQGLTLLGVALSNLADDGRGPARAAVRPAPRGRARRRGRRRARALRLGAITRAVLLGRDQGISMPVLPD